MSRKPDVNDVLTTLRQYHRFMSASVYDPGTLAAFVKETPKPFLTLNQQLIQLLSVENIALYYEAVTSFNEGLAKFLHDNPSITQFFIDNLDAIRTLGDEFQEFEYSLKIPQVKKFLGEEHFAFMCLLFQQDLPEQKSEDISTLQHGGEPETDTTSTLKERALQALADISLFYPTEYEKLKTLFSRSMSLSSRKKEFLSCLDAHPRLACYLHDIGLPDLAIHISQYYGKGPNIRLFQTKQQSSSDTPEPPPEDSSFSQSA